MVFKLTVHDPKENCFAKPEDNFLNFFYSIPINKLSRHSLKGKEQQNFQGLPQLATLVQRYLSVNKDVMKAQLPSCTDGRPTNPKLQYYT